jgi:hypothetical protein
VIPSVASVDRQVHFDREAHHAGDRHFGYRQRLFEIAFKGGLEFVVAESLTSCSCGAYRVGPLAERRKDQLVSVLPAAEGEGIERAHAAPPSSLAGHRLARSSWQAIR